MIRAIPGVDLITTTVIAALLVEATTAVQRALKRPLHYVYNVAGLDKRAYPPVGGDASN